MTGCWAQGHLSYREHPELAGIKLATGQAYQGSGLGVVQTEASGTGDCSGLVTRALRDLLAEAQALGGLGVEDVKFRARWNWTGSRVLCRKGFLGLRKYVAVRGVAVK